MSLNIFKAKFLNSYIRKISKISINFFKYFFYLYQSKLSISLLQLSDRILDHFFSTGSVFIWELFFLFICSRFPNQRSWRRLASCRVWNLETTGVKKEEKKERKATTQIFPIHFFTHLKIINCVIVYNTPPPPSFFTIPFFPFLSFLLSALFIYFPSLHKHISFLPDKVFEYKVRGGKGKNKKKSEII